MNLRQNRCGDSKSRMKLGKCTFISVNKLSWKLLPVLFSWRLAARTVNMIVFFSLNLWHSYVQLRFKSCTYVCHGWISTLQETLIPFNNPKTSAKCVIYISSDFSTQFFLFRRKNFSLHCSSKYTVYNNFALGQSPQLCADAVCASHSSLLILRELKACDFIKFTADTTEDTNFYSNLGVRFSQASPSDSSHDVKALGATVFSKT